jgi:hypothetical protein
MIWSLRSDGTSCRKYLVGCSSGIPRRGSLLRRSSRSVQGLSLSLARNPMLWIGGAVLTVVVIVLIVMAAMGKFSS